MKKLIEFIASAIVDQPEKIELEEIKDSQAGLTQLSLKVAPEDMGKIIGKRGKIIKAIRTLIRVKSIIKREKVIFNLKED